MSIRSLVMLLAILTASAQARQIGRGVNFYSREKEAALGAQMAKEVRLHTTAIQNAETRDYVESIGRKLAEQLPEPRYTYTFTIVSDDLGGPTHEPVALPGGYIFVPEKLIQAVQNDAEFAGMLAHAMAHVAARHSTRQMTRGELIPAGAGVGMMRFSRGFETEADVLAIGMMRGAGYDPEALVRYIRRVQPDALPR